MFKVILTSVIHLLCVALMIFISFSSILFYDQIVEFYGKQFPQVSFNRRYAMAVSIYNFISVITIFYTFYFVIFNLLIKKKVNIKNGALAVLAMVAILLFLGILREIVPAIRDMVAQNYKFSFNDIKGIKIINLLFTLGIIGVIALGVRGFIEYLSEKQRVKELESSKLKSELHLLRTQVNPHFIFNTLNNIDVLIKKDPDLASNLVIKLSEDMRYMLYDANIEEIDLASELKFLKNYIALQEIRIRKPNFIHLNEEIEDPNRKIAPMMFIPLVENAFKHCRTPQENDSITIVFKQKENNMQFSIANFYNENETKTEVGGIGLDLVKKRFELIYPKKHRLEIISENHIFNVSYTIQLDEN